MTLAEHEALLKAEGRYESIQALHRQQDEERQARVAEWRRAELPLREDLRATGVDVASVWDLVNTRAPYPSAIPILLEHLSRSYPERVREGIARALAVPEAHHGWATLLTAFRTETDATTHGVKWAVACALGAAATDDELAEVSQLLRDRSLGRNRAPLLQVLARSQRAEAAELLQELLAEPELVDDVKKALRSQRVRKTPRRASSRGSS